MSLVAINRYNAGVLESADSVSLTITDATGAAVLGPVMVVPTSAGVYNYTTISLGSGLYTATWVFTVAGQTDESVSRVFQVEAPIATVQGVTLAELERKVAARCGPFRSFQAGVGSTVNDVVITRLRTSLDIGDFEDLFLLRRGRSVLDELIAGFDDDDRQRIVAAYSGSTGALSPDLAWANAPIEDERIELHYLDPEQELRPAVRLGLERCYFEDTVDISATGYLREIDLTDAAWWITRASQVRRVEYGRLTYVLSKAPWFEAFQQGDSVKLKTILPNVGTLRITALRPHSTFVNGEDSFSGPDADDDLLSVHPLYAVRAGHIAAWELATAKLADVAAQGRALQMKQAADAFTAASMAYAKLDPQVIQNRFGQEDFLTSLQVGNA